MKSKYTGVKKKNKGEGMKTRVERAKIRRRRTLQTLAIVLVLFMVTLSATGYIYASTLLEKEVIHEGVSVNGFSVGDMTKERAKIELERVYSEELSQKKLLIKYEDYLKEVGYGDIGAEYDYDSVVEDAFKVGRSGGFLENIGSILKAKNGDADIAMIMETDSGRIDKILESIKMELDREPVNATIDASSGEIVLVEEQNGRAVDMELLAKRVQEGLESGKEIEIPLELELPKVKSSDLKEIKKQIGYYSTSFSSGDLGRNHNILLSSESIDGQIVMPGDVFSFNDSTGLRDRANGYRESIIIVNKKPVPGVGGGVCQTSSTLYNAIANTGLEVVERHNHSLPVGYLPRGMDATVSDNTLDFRFKNSFDYPIFIKSDIVGNTVQVRIYGK